MRHHARLAGLAVAALSAAAISGIAPTSAVAADHGPADRALQAAKDHAAATHFGAGQALQVVDTILDADGDTHVRMHRSYRGLPVLGGDLVVHQSANGAWHRPSQTLEHGVSLATRPTVTRKQAGAQALRSVPNGTRGAEVEDTDLVVDATGAQPRLAWEVRTGGVQADGTPSRLATYVDARSGVVLRSEQGIQTTDGSGQTLYSGTVPLQLTPSGSGYQLKDPTRGGTYTVDVNNGTDNVLCTIFGFSCPAETLFTSPDTSFGNGATSSRESAAAGAQYGTNMTWDFYENTFGRLGIFGDGSGSYNRVHYGKNYVNAFWDGTRMTYGDGDGASFGPLTSLDVTGHEMSHGVTEHTAGLTYSGESGGLNESTSDIFGTMVEFYAANSADPGDYLIGEEFDLKNHLGFRRMDDPDSDGASLNCWSSSAGNVDVHYSSGIGNHFFYLLSEGSGAKTLNGVSYDSPTCDGSSVSGIGRDAAAAIWYRALTVYMTSDTDYHGARTATLDAATDLYGSGSTQYNAVAAAWSAVSVS
ncbi:MAG TPA: M4 family metallopeptidase [Marmoricola sp.]|nr:M4 family metallopeptidase [Marmoricola sp.]